MKRDITQSVKFFTEVEKSLFGTRKETNPTNKLWDSIKATIDMLNSTEGVEMASAFWFNATEVLENETMHMLWLAMRSRSGWLDDQPSEEDPMIAPRS